MTTANAESKTYSLNVEKRIARPRAEVFRAIGEGRLFFNCGVSQAKSEIDFRQGGKYVIAWPQYGFENRGEFTVVTPHSHIAFTWVQNPTESKTPDTLVTVDLVDDGAGTIIKLKHAGFKDQETAADHEGGWSGGLTDLGAEMVDGKLLIIRPFAMPAAALFDACLKPATLFGQMGDASQAKVDARVGGRFEVPNGHGGARGAFVEIDAGKKLVFTWEGGCDGEKLANSRVTLLFEADDEDAGKTWITLTHEGLDSEKQQKAHRERWDAILGDLLS
jgi:uncharacterized protein YndB with AHSA1/START domain